MRTLMFLNSALFSIDVSQGLSQKGNVHGDVVAQYFNAVNGGSSECWGLGSDAESYWLKPQCGQTWK